MASRLTRWGVLTAGTVLVGLALLASPAYAAAVPEVTVAAPRTVIGPAGDVVVRVTLSNPTVVPMRVLEWSTPADTPSEPLFDVTRDGVPAEYLGPVVKRAAPTAADYLLLEPGASRTYDVDLGALYSFAADGAYEVRYRTAATDLLSVGRLKVAGGLVSNEIGLVVAGRPDPVPDPAVGASSATNPGCSAGQDADLAAALTAANVYAGAAAQYLADNRAGARYQTWFGTYDASRWQTVRTHFQAIAAVTGGTSVRFTCGDPLCNGGTFAFVYPNAPYMIYVCGAFWAAALTGTDSRAGTLIHEITHFTVVAGTVDHVYGQSGAMALAISSPANAVGNADNHEYFSEDTPATADNAPAFVVSALAHDFGSQTLGSSGTAFTFTVTSTGDAPVVFGTTAAVGDFSLTGGTCSGATIAPAASCAISVVFAPSVAGARSGTIALPSNAVAAPTALQLTGSGEVTSAPSSETPVVSATPVTAAPTVAAAPPAVRLAARAQASSRLAITVGAKSTERWTFRIRVRRPNGKWAMVTTARDVPGGATRIIDLPKGSYQVVVDAANGMAAATSSTVTLRR